MAKYIYPAIFSKEDDFFLVRFPDVEGCYTQGDSLQDAYDMATDALCLMLYDREEDGKSIPKASDIADVEAGVDEFVSLVACDTLEYRKHFGSRAVKKTLTIPAWLNTISEREGINFSQVLQNALKKELRIAE